MKGGKKEMNEGGEKEGDEGRKGIRRGMKSEDMVLMTNQSIHFIKSIRSPTFNILEYTLQDGRVSVTQGN